MRNALLAAGLGLVLVTSPATALPPVSTTLTNLTVTANTGEKPQSKVWTYDGKWWCVMPKSDGTWVWRLDGTAWTSVLQLSAATGVHADVKVVGGVCHVLLFNSGSSELASIEYVPLTQTYQFWTTRPANVALPLDAGTETATLDVDSQGRMWMASDHAAGTDQIVVYYSDAPYSSWSGAVTIATGITADDIALVTAMPGGKVGVLWSNQNSQRFGFRFHADGDAPGTWSADEVPASQSALNVGLGMGDDHMHVAVASDGTLYAAVKTSYDTAGYPKIALLVRRPAGTWDDLYEVDQAGTRGIVLLDEAAGKVTVVYTSVEGSGNILYKESPTSAISMSGPSTVLIPGGLNDATSMKENINGSVVILAGNGSSLQGRLLTSAADYTITASAGSGGTIAPGGAVSVSSGSNQAFTITPASCFDIADVLVDGVSVGAVASYTFSNVLANHTIAASFTPRGPLTITATAGANGTISPSGAASVTCGANQAFTITAGGGYHVSDVLVDAVSVGAVTSYTFNNVTTNHTITASFASDPLPSGLLGWWKMDGNVNDSSGNAYHATAFGSPGYVAGADGQALNLSGAGQFAAVPDNAALRIPGNAFTLATWVKPTLEGTQNLISKSTNGGAGGYELCLAATSSTWPHKAFFRMNQVASGDTYRVNSTTQYSDHLNSWIHLAATFDGATMKLYVNGGLESSLPAPITLAQNSLPVGLGAQVDAANAGTRLLTGGMDDARIYDRALGAAEIAALAGLPVTTHTITASAGANGTISPSGAVIVGDGASQAFTITPAACFDIADVLVDGSSVGAVASYTFPSVIGDHTIAASFVARPALTITATAGANGTISPGGPVSVACGANQAFVITAGGGYHVADVLVDAVSVGAVTSYTFNNVGANHTIAASFAPDASGSDLVGRWRMDEGSGTLVSDDSPNGLHGTAVGNPAWVSGVNGPFALSFTNNTSQYVTVPNAAPLNITSAITMAAWIRPTQVATASILNKATFATGPVLGYELDLSTSGFPFVRLFNDTQAVGGGRLNATIAYPTNGTTWMHVAATYDGATIKLYINGVLNVSRAATTPIPTNSLPFVIGAPSDGAAARVFPGAIDDARLYNRALTDAEIAALANLAPTHTITASAGTGGTITPSGAVTVGEGANQAFAIAANAGYQIADVLVDGGSIGAAASHTFTNVTADHTIAASFAAITTTALASNNNPSSFGSSVTLTATVTPVPLAGGTVTFLDNGVSIGAGTTDGGGVATLATSTLAVGSHPLTARFEGDASHALSTSSPALSQVVNAPASTVDVGPASGMITLGNPVRTVPVTISRGDLTPLLAFSVTFSVSSQLAVSGGTGGIHEGAYLSDANPATSFNLIDLGTDGGGNHSYEVDGATLGAPCGSSAASGTLFTIDLASPAGSGPGLVTITNLKLRNCSNADLASVIGTSSSIGIDQSAPLVQVIAPNGGETWPIGSSRTVSWSGSDPEGVAAYDLAYSTDGGASYPNAIATVPGTQASYAWTVPPAPGSAIRVRVTGQDVNGNAGADASDANFTIGCPLITVTAVTTHVACNGGSSGAIDISVSGGTAPYTYAWGDGPTSEDRADLAAGSYALIVTDANGCTGSLNLDITQPAVLAATETHTESCLSSPDGTIDVSVTGGTAPYTFAWGDGPTSEDRAGLAAGSYALTVTDANGCTAGLNVPIGLRSYTITASAGPDGAIAPDGPVSVACGADQGFALTADAGHHVADVLVDGVSVGAPTSYTFSNVTQDHTIAVSFVVNAPVPAITGLSASQNWTGNPAGATTGTTLSWDATANTVEVWRAGFGHYPEYGDEGGSVPSAAPTYPPGAGWVKTGVTAPGGTDYVTTRDYYYYVAYQQDVYGTWSPASSMTSGTLNYHLGDVSNGVTIGVGNNSVLTEDVSLLGGHYGIADAAVTPFAYLDIGPTTTGFVDGLPTTDNKINFEDLVLMAINYGAVSPPIAGPQPLEARADAVADALALEAPDRVSTGATVTARLLLQGSGDLVALSTALSWDPAVVEPIGQAAGAWLSGQNGIAFSAAPGTVDAAVLQARGMSGEGELATVTFRARTAGDPKLRILSTDGRDARNQKLAVTSSLRPQVAAVPALTQLAPTRPNPFRERATVAFSLAQGGPVELLLYSVDGRRVRTLAKGVHGPGEYTLVWDGRDDHGGPVSAGVYYLRLTTGQGRFTRTMTYLK